MLASVPVAAGVVAGFHNFAVVPVELAAIGSMFVLDRVATSIIGRWHRGALGEEHVGTIIDSLGSDGWLAIHDASTGRGNIDHILVGLGGLFTVEAKSTAAGLIWCSLTPDFSSRPMRTARSSRASTALGSNRYLHSATHSSLAAPRLGVTASRFPRRACCADTSPHVRRAYLRPASLRYTGIWPLLSNHASATISPACLGTNGHWKPPEPARLTEPAEQE